MGIEEDKDEEEDDGGSREMKEGEHEDNEVAEIDAELIDHSSPCLSRTC